MIAGFFHKSAFLAIIFYFAPSFKLKTSHIVITLLSLPIISNAFNSLVVRYIPRYTVYTQMMTVQQGTKAIFIFIVLGIVALVLRKKIIKDDKVAEIYYNIFFMGLSIYLLFFEQGTMGHRLSLYGTIYSILLIPKIVSLFGKKNRILVNSIIYIGCIIMFFYIIKVGTATYLPYRFIFNNN